jgi:protein-S-isoprenylcysteine O-methyltransferase Ste14
MEYLRCVGFGQRFKVGGEELGWSFALVVFAVMLGAVVSYQAGEKIRYSPHSPVRALGFLLVGIGLLCFGLIAFLILDDLVLPLFLALRR